MTVYGSFCHCSFMLSLKRARGGKHEKPQRHKTPQFRGEVMRRPCWFIMAAQCMETDVVGYQCDGNLWKWMLIGEVYRSRKMGCVCLCASVHFKPWTSVLIKPSSRCCLLDSWSINNHIFRYGGKNWHMEEWREWTEGMTTGWVQSIMRDRWGLGSLHPPYVRVNNTWFNAKTSH